MRLSSAQLQRMLDAIISRAKHLRVTRLLLSGNELTFIPDVVWEFRNLRALMLDRNRLSCVRVVRLPKLAVLSLDCNDALPVCDWICVVRDNRRKVRQYLLEGAERTWHSRKLTYATWFLYAAAGPCRAMRLPRDVRKLVADSIMRLPFPVRCK